MATRFKTKEEARLAQRKMGQDDQRLKLLGGGTARGAGKALSGRGAQLQKQLKDLGI